MSKIVTTQQQGIALGVTTADRERVGAYIAASLSPATLRAYSTDQKTFVSWCALRGVSPDEAGSAIIAAWLAEMAEKGRKASGVARARAAIVHYYKMRGFTKATNPAVGDGVDTVMAGIRRTHGSAPAKKIAATDDKIAIMLSHCPDTLAGKRDKALLALGFMGAFRRSELVALNVEDIRLGDGGAYVTIRRSKTDQEGAGQTIAIPNGARLRALDHLASWLAAAAITSGPIFRSINRHGQLSSNGISGQTVADTVKRYAKAAGMKADDVSGHSLRAGFVTSAAMAGESATAIADTSRHKNMNVLLGYVQTAGLIKNSAGRSFA